MTNGGRMPVTLLLNVLIGACAALWIVLGAVDITLDGQAMAPPVHGFWLAALITVTVSAVSMRLTTKVLTALDTDPRRGSPGEDSAASAPQRSFALVPPQQGQIQDGPLPASNVIAFQLGRDAERSLHIRTPG